MKSCVLAIDLGSSSVKMLLGTLNDGRIEITEVDRFKNESVYIGNSLHWDIENIFTNIKKGIKKACETADVKSIAVDSWGVDFGLVGKNGALIEAPYCYRDDRTYKMVEESERYIDGKELYLETGNQIMNINTLFQLLALKKENLSRYEETDKILMISDLITYLLTGKMYGEECICSTTQMYDQFSRKWNGRVIGKCGLDCSKIPDIIKPGTYVGGLKKEIRSELGIGDIDVYAVASHDTASAVVAIPAYEREFMYISSGSWSVMGIQLEKPIISNESYELNFTNESGFDNTVRFQKNITGLWLMQELQRHFEENGKMYSFADMSGIADETGLFDVFIDTDYYQFSSKGNIVGKIQDYLKKTNQRLLTCDAEFISCVYNSLALKYKYTYNMQKKVVQKDFDRLYVTGGGIRDEYLCRITADAIGKPVIAGPTDGTALGNIAVQLFENGYINDIKDAIIKSVEVKAYEPKNPNQWEKTYSCYRKVMESEISE